MTPEHFVSIVRRLLELSRAGQFDLWVDNWKISVARKAPVNYEHVRHPISWKHAEAIANRGWWLNPPLERSFTEPGGAE